MKIIVFITDLAAVGRIIDHIKLTFVADKPLCSHVFEQITPAAAERSRSLVSFSQWQMGFCHNMLFRSRLLLRLTLPGGRKYITSVVKRGDSSVIAAIHRAAEKAKSHNCKIDE